MAAEIVDWTQVCVWAVVLAAVICAVVKFIRMPSDEQIRIIKECLLNWVVQAEAELGSGTGRVKLSEVYGQFCSSFPLLKSAVSFEQFSAWVDEALDQMREMLRTNPSLRDAILIDQPSAHLDAPP